MRTHACMFVGGYMLLKIYDEGVCRVSRNGHQIQILLLDMSIIYCHNNAT